MPADFKSFIARCEARGGAGSRKLARLRQAAFHAMPYTSAAADFDAAWQAAERDPERFWREAEADER